MKSLGAMIKQIDGLADTRDVTDWENEFIKDVVGRTKCGLITTILKEGTVKKIEQIWSKHFAG